jgi:RecA-family ATPase
VRRELRDIAASEIVPAEPAWLWERRFPLGSVTIVAGPKGSNKTTFATWLTAMVSSGLHPEIQRGNVIFSSVEDSLSFTLRPRIEAAGGALEHVFFPAKEEESINFPDDTELLARKINERRAKLVVIDPLEGHLSPRTSTTSNVKMRRLLQGLERVADSSGCAIVVIHHWTKAAGSAMGAILHAWIGGP